MYKFWQKRDWNCAFMVPPNTHSLMKRRSAPLQPPEIIYFCKFRPKRAWKWNYGYLPCKIQNFLIGKGAPPPCNHIRIHFDRKGTEIVHLWFPQIHILLWKEQLPLATNQILYISVNWDQKGPEIMHVIFSSQNTKFSLASGCCPLATPKSYSSVSLDQKGPEFMYIYARKI